MGKWTLGRTGRGGEEGREGLALNLAEASQGRGPTPQSQHNRFALHTCTNKEMTGLFKGKDSHLDLTDNKLN